jgi:hypothetical protein
VYANEEILHYAAAFLDRYDVQNKSHKEAVKQLRKISDELLEKLYQPISLNVIRKPKTEA